MRENTLDIIYVNYNTAGQILDSLATLGKAIKKYSYTVTVVDNNSCEDDLIDSLESHPNVSLIKLDKNYGFGYANNRGFEATNSPLVLFLNPDTLLEEDSLDVMVSYLLSHEQVGIVGANLFNAEGNPAHSFRRIHFGVRLELSNALGHLPLKILYGKSEEHNFKGKPLEVAYVCGANMMTRREILDETGTFNECFFMYFEDEELSMRVSKLGYKIVSLPDAKIKHLEGKSIALKEVRERMQDDSRRIFYRMVGKGWHLPIANALNYLLLNLGKLVCILKGHDKRHIYDYRIKLIRERGLC